MLPSTLIVLLGIAVVAGAGVALIMSGLRGRRRSCPKCGKDNPVRAQFCSQCGRPLRGG